MKMAESKNILLFCLSKKEISANIFEKFLPDDWQNLFTLAKKQYVQNILFEKLKENELTGLIPQEQYTELKKYQELSTMENLRLKRELTLLTKTFSENGIPVLALKGSHLAFFVYPHISLRFMRDLDLLVPSEKGKQAFLLAEKLGYVSTKELTEDNFAFRYDNQLPEMSKNGIVLEIHNNIIRPDKDYSIPAEVLWESIEQKNLGSFPLNIFSPDELILHLCTHISYRDTFRADLRHYYDIFSAINLYQKSLNWDVLSKKTKERKWEKGVFLVLKVVEKIFEIKLSENLVDIDKDEFSEMLEFALDVMWEYDRNSEKHLFNETSTLNYRDFSQENLIGKIKIIYRRIFLSQEDMIRRYSLKKNSLKLYLMYFWRIFDLPNSNKNRMLNFKQDLNFQNYISKRSSLLEWLNNN